MTSDDCSKQADDRLVVYRQQTRFQLWHYGISHSQLLLRSPIWRDGKHDGNIDVLFTGVVAVYVRQTYPSIVVRRASDDETASIRATSGVGDPWFLCYVLGEGLNEGWVQCGAVIVLEEHLDLMRVPLSPPGATPMPIDWRPADDTVVLAADPPDDDPFGANDDERN